VADAAGLNGAASGQEEVAAVRHSAWAVDGFGDEPVDGFAVDLLAEFGLVVQQEGEEGQPALGAAVVRSSSPQVAEQRAGRGGVQAAVTGSAGSST